MRTKIWIVGTFAALGLIVGLWAQDGPNSQGSQTVARPRKAPSADNGNTNNNAPADSDADQPKIPSKLSPKATKDNTTDADATFKAETNVVNVDVQVLDNNGNPIPNIPRDRFRILEDNVPQTLTQFNVGEAPMTVALVVEFSARFQAFYSSGWAETLTASYGFVQSLKPDDYLAVIAYDLHSTILSDFTNDRTKTMDAMSRLRIPGFSESNMFDALADTADRMSKIEGRKAIVLIASGIDTFSKLTYDKARKALQESGVPIYSIEMLQIERILAEARGGMGPSQELTFLQADNELKTFGKETGGQAYFPRFIQELPGVFQSISQSLRNQYSLGYSPNNQARDGKFRKITVQLVNPGTNEPLRMVNEKGKPMKYTILAKAGYTAPRAVE
ncbi:MAG TPA: VWA domain-containing protein [Bryobacteraceae bacterium]|jgi:Ca-activated chloride channel family protein|nr:VWA domain-containing protein [Bryobacteraceae bacterium]